EGKPSVTAVIPADRYSDSELLRLAAAVESASEHPLARAIVDAARDRLPGGGRLPTGDDFDAPPRKGGTGRGDGPLVAAGPPALLRAHGVGDQLVADLLTAPADDLRRSGATAVLVAVDGRPAGVIGVADRVKDTTPAALAALRAEGIEVIMLTGDNE